MSRRREKSEHDARAEALVMEQLRPFGKPATVMLEENVVDDKTAIRLTNAIYRNWEERLCELERLAAVRGISK